MTSGAVAATAQHRLQDRLTLVDLVDRLLNKGVVVSGDVILAVGDIDLVRLDLRLLLASVGALAERGESPS